MSERKLLECPECGAEFHRNPLKVKTAKINYCSHKCRGMAETKEAIANFPNRHVGAESGCYLWTGSKNQSGYGTAKYRGKSIRAHQLSYIINVGPIPTGMYVLHRCDNRLCVNPGHLFIGTHADNMRDMAAKGRRYHKGRKPLPPLPGEKE